MICRPLRAILWTKRAPRPRKTAARNQHRLAHAVRAPPSGRLSRPAPVLFNSAVIRAPRAIPQSSAAWVHAPPVRSTEKLVRAASKHPCSLHARGLDPRPPIAPPAPARPGCSTPACPPPDVPTRRDTANPLLTRLARAGTREEARRARMSWRDVVPVRRLRGRGAHTLTELCIAARTNVCGMIVLRA
ncbi:hypothetical protein FA95DRAFT_1345897 [Auriscalpium vulgare]|uniref:Uncharacterized protein n=1 Tax=Auriscalpium vulgare TaxID=40419 RepID=A0ACB8RSD4_9AGAM|nr:hypothetical protein FA95DRAFT_1345897 [Auriscalpium vulgare]